MRYAIILAIGLCCTGFIFPAMVVASDVIVDEPEPAGSELVGNWSFPGSPNDGIALDSTLVNDDDPCGQLGLPSCKVSDFPSTVSPAGDRFMSQLAVGRTAVTLKTIEAVARRTRLNTEVVLRMRAILLKSRAAGQGEQCFVTSALSRLRKLVRVYGFLKRYRTITSMSNLKAYCGFPARRVFTLRDAIRKVDVRLASGCRFLEYAPPIESPAMSGYPDEREIYATYWDSSQTSGFYCKQGSELSIIGLCLQAQLFGGSAYWRPCPGYLGSPENIEFKQVVP